jgi:hypothetical protein
MSPNRSEAGNMILAGAARGAAKSCGRVVHCLGWFSTAFRTYWASSDALDSYGDPLSLMTNISVPKCPEIAPHGGNTSMCPEMSPNLDLRTFRDTSSGFSNVCRFGTFVDKADRFCARPSFQLPPTSCDYIRHCPQMSSNPSSVLKYLPTRMLAVGNLKKTNS